MAQWSKRAKALAYVAGFLCALLIGGAFYVRSYLNGLSGRVKLRVQQALSDRFDADVNLDSLQLSIFPMPSATGEGLSIRHREWSDQQPLIYIKRFHARTDFWTLINRNNRVDLVRLEGLAIRIPPRGRSALGSTFASNQQTQNGQDKTHLQFLIQTIVADKTLLEILPKIPSKDPLSFEIEKLSLRSVGPANAMAFTAKLTNAKPPGLIDTVGSFGPWQKDDPRSTPVSGTYVFNNADLSVFKGISGILSSTGKYDGVLQHIEVDGSTDTPDFALKRGGDPVHLTTKFHSIVDGTDGDTILNPVDATFGRSEFVCRGGVVHQEGTKGKTVSLDAQTTHARMEDILLLVMGNKPMLEGDVDFKSKIVIPPGHDDVLNKLDLDGQFRLLSAKFTSPELAGRLNTLSDRASGISKKEEEEGKGAHGNVASNLQGVFKLDQGVTTFSRLSFSVPGALVQLHGSYNLRSGKIDMQGTFGMQATLAETQSGIKSLLLRPLDPMFKKKGAGFEVPLKITGTREHPEIGVDVFHKQFTIH